MKPLLLSQRVQHEKCLCILRGSVGNIEWWRAHVVATPTLTNIFRIVPKLNGFLYTRLHWNGSIVSDWENDIKQQSAWKQQQQYLQIMAEFIVIDFVGNLNKTLMGLDEQLVRQATKMNFHSPLNYNATCTLMLPKSKLFFFTENRTSRVEKNTTKIRMKMDCRNWLFKSWIVLSTGKITIHGIA